MAGTDKAGIEKTVKIFIASSSELEEERNKLVLIINGINKSYKHLKIEPIMWETDIESGSYQRERIQDEINPLLLASDIVLVLVYSKIGKFTYEEYRLAQVGKKKTFIYFKTGFSPPNVEGIDDYKEVLELKGQLVRDNKTLYLEYDNLDKFEALIQKDLSKYLSKRFLPIQAEKPTEFDEYRMEIQIVEVNRGAATDEPLFEKDPGELDEKQLSKFFELPRVKAKLREEDAHPLAKLSYLDLLKDNLYVVKGSFLCLGTMIRDVCPSASISKFIVFEDNEGLRPIINERVEGNLVTQYFSLLEHLRKNLYLVRDIYSDNKEDYEIPDIVFREMLANAFVHRDYGKEVKASIQVELYPDRLTIKNPGNFPDEIDLENLDNIEMSYIKHVQIAEIFFLYKIIEEAGKGIHRIRSELKKRCFNPVVFTQDPGGDYVKVTVHKKKSREKKSTKGKTKLLTTLPPRGINFINRKKALAETEEILKNRDGALLISGMGGIGKTEFCKHLFIRHYQDYDFASWIDYTTSLKVSLVNAIRHAEAPIEAESDFEERFREIVSFLIQLGSDGLLVIDNIDNWEDEDLDLLRTLPCKVVVNSRASLPGFQKLEIDCLSVSDCMDLFYGYYQEGQDDTTLEKIVELAGRHTLTLELLARTAQNAALSIEALYDKLVDTGFNLNDAVPELIATSWHNDRTYKHFFDYLLSIFDLSGLTKEESYVLVNLSVLPGVSIPIADFARWLGLESKDTINGLVLKGLLRREGFSILGHRVIAEVVRYKEVPNTNKCKKLICSLADELYLEPGDNPLDKFGHTVFADSILRYVKADNESLSILANNLAAIYKDTGQLYRAMEYQERALSIWEKILPPDHHDLAGSYNNLSMIYQDLGRLDEALAVQQKAVVIREKILSADHPSLAASYNNLSMIYQDLGRLDEALAAQERAISIQEKILSADHPDLAGSYNNLAAIYRAQGRLDEALAAQQKVVEIREKILSADHPSLATSYNNLSMVYQDLGRLEEALAAQERAISIQEKILSADHPDLAVSYNNLSMIYQNLGRLDEALVMAQQAVAILEKLFPQGHPHLDLSRKNLTAIEM